jgi:hypothetical protein
MIMRLSEPLGPQQSVSEVDQQPESDEGGERVIEGHCSLLEPFADVGVSHRQREKTEPEGQQDDVEHCVLLATRVGSKAGQQALDAGRLPGAQHVVGEVPPSFELACS